MSGTFTQGIKKQRPGVYVNVKSRKNQNTAVGQTGTVLIPFVTHDYGPVGQPIRLTADSPNDFYESLGYSVGDVSNANMILVREALKNAANVIVYIIKTGTKATGTGGGLTATAKHGGTRGNSLSYAVTANATETSKFDITVSLGSEIVSQHTLIADIAGAIAIDDPWVDFSAAGEEATLAAVASVKLAGATAATVENSDVTGFLDSIENVGFDVLLFPSTVADLQTAFVEKVKYLNATVGKNIIGVVANKAADYYGIINVTNSVKTSDGISLTVPQAAAWVAGATAAAGCTDSLTWKPYDDAVEVINVKGYEAGETANKNGEFFFSYNDGVVIVDADINSLVNVGADQDDSYKKNRVIRTIYEVIKSIKAEFAPGKFSNIEDNWDIMDQHGQAILNHFMDIGAIKSVSDGDFAVDRKQSEGDSVYFDVYIQPVDSAEKLYVTVYTN